jgi:O-antigen/teichoic acid export membrane protein
MSGALALLMGVGFVLVAPAVSDRLSPLFAGPLMAATFVLSVVLWCVFSLQDGVLTALRRAAWVPVENALFGLVKLVLLLVFASVFVSGGIFASWNIPVLLAVIPVNVLIFGRLIATRARSAEVGGPFSLRSVARFVAVDYVSGLFLQSYTTALPLIIVATLGPRANAEFYVAYVVIAAVDLVSVNLATSLLVEAAHDEARLREYTRRILRRSAQLLLPAVILIELGAPYFTRLLGASYAHNSTTLLRLLALASLARMVNIVYMATMRVQRRVGRVVVTQAAICALVVSLTIAFAPSIGVEGVGLAWLCAHVAVLVALLPWLRRTLERSR